MTNRLPYETKGGHFSPAETHLQLLEHLRLAAEACYALGHHAKANNDFLVGQGYLAYGELLEKKIAHVITTLATRGMIQ